MFFDIYNIFKNWLFGAEAVLETWQIQFLNLISIVFIFFSVFFIVNLLYNIVRTIFRW